MRFQHKHTPLVGVVFGCCLWAASALAVVKDSSYQAALESIQAEKLAAVVGHLADPQLEGREAGEPGGLAAGEWLAKQYANLHLRGSGDHGELFQPFPPNFRNILTLMPGSDPKLRDQVILVCAHYDHLGYGGDRALGPYGSIYPGADDNASGSAAILELARAMTKLAPPPKRSIVFAAWDAEEKGLLGSKYWVAHPTFAIDRIAAVVNCDMVGRLRDARVTLIASRSGAGWLRLLSEQNDGGLRLDFPWGIKANADHYPFFDQGIPAVLFHTGMHEDYHRPSDTADRINNDGMMQVTRILFAVVCELADRPATLAFRAAARRETPEAEREMLDDIAEPADRLGVGWTDDAATAGGIRVSRVTLDSPADHAGLQVGDCIVQFAGKTIRSDDDFCRAVMTAGRSVAITVKRDGQAEEKPLELKASLVGEPLRWGIRWRVDDAEPGAVILTHVLAGSPAARAGLAVGDRIYQVGGRDFTDEAEFVQRMKANGDVLPILIERDGRLRLIQLEIRRVEPLKRAA
jgi:hypothetical protein